MSKLEQAEALVELWVKEKQESPKRLTLLIEAEDLLAAVETVKDWGYFAALIGLDEGANLAALYLFCAGDEVLGLKVTLPRENPSLASISPIVPAAILQERELEELFGIRVEGLNGEHLLLPDDWPAGLYPLRKDAVLS
jgi:Ni,Fe-hydrogenase III component G